MLPEFHGIEIAWLRRCACYDVQMKQCKLQDGEIIVNGGQPEIGTRSLSPEDAAAEFFTFVCQFSALRFQDTSDLVCGRFTSPIGREKFIVLGGYKSIDSPFQALTIHLVLLYLCRISSRGEVHTCCHWQLRQSPPPRREHGVPRKPPFGPPR